MPLLKDVDNLLNVTGRFGHLKSQSVAISCFHKTLEI